MNGIPCIYSPSLHMIFESTKDQSKLHINIKNLAESFVQSTLMQHVTLTIFLFSELKLILRPVIYCFSSFFVAFCIIL